MDAKRVFVPLVAAIALSACASSPDSVSLPPAPASANDACHLVSEDLSRSIRCGTAEQWDQLKAAAGFSCTEAATFRGGATFIPPS